nr:hypothetical protein [Paenibacillus ihumii]
MQHRYKPAFDDQRGRAKRDEQKQHGKSGQRQQQSGPGNVKAELIDAQQARPAIRNSLADMRPAASPVIMDAAPIAAFSRKSMRSSCFTVMPCRRNIPNSLLRD